MKTKTLQIIILMVAGYFLMDAGYNLNRVTSADLVNFYSVSYFIQMALSGFALCFGFGMLSLSTILLVVKEIDFDLTDEVVNH